jgi:hypothetical protein
MIYHLHCLILSTETHVDEMKISVLKLGIRMLELRPLTYGKTYIKNKKKRVQITATK